MTILNQKKVRFVNDETLTRKPGSSMGIYPNADKVAQYRLVADNRTEKGEAKQEIAKKTAT